VLFGRWLQGNVYECIAIRITASPSKSPKLSESKFASTTNTNFRFDSAFGVGEYMGCLFHTRSNWIVCYNLSLAYTAKSSLKGKGIERNFCSSDNSGNRCGNLVFGS
jgi:hypothetical protein